MSVPRAHAGPGLPPDQTGTEVPEQSSGFLFQLRQGLPPGARVAVDPHDMHRNFPDRWQRFLLAHYRNEADTAAAFGVTERTARKWRQGIGGCNGDKVAIAVERHPDTAPHYLFAAE